MLFRTIAYKVLYHAVANAPHGYSAGKTIAEEVERIMAPYGSLPTPCGIELTGSRATKR